MRKFTNGLCWLWIAILILLLDQGSKHWVLKNLSLYAEIPIFPHFNLWLAYNKGAAFSLLNEASGWQVFLFGGIAVVMSIIILIWLSRLSWRERWLSIALNLMLGGAIGNLCDRLLHGKVVDFFDFYADNLHFPTFNVADIAICLGVFILFVEALLLRNK